MATDFNAVSLTPLTTIDYRALVSLACGWSPPLGAWEISSATIGPQAYRRRRRRNAAIAAGVLGGVVMLVPSLALGIAWFNGDAATLADSRSALLVFSTFAAVLAIAGAAISWFQTSGRHRTSAGAEPATQLTFVATANGLAVGDAAGGRLTGPWSHWRIANLRSQVAYLKSGQLHTLEALDLVLLGDDGASAGSVTMDPATLARGRDAAAAVVGMIVRARER